MVLSIPSTQSKEPIRRLSIQPKQATSRVTVLLEMFPQQQRVVQGGWGAVVLVQEL